MGKISYSEKLRDPRWQRVRLKVLERDQFTCQKCSDIETTLNVHHINYKKGVAPWDYPMENYLTLCEHCHFEISGENQLYPIELIRIFKSKNWQDGSRIMFISLDGILSMIIYDKDGCICGYNFDNDTLIELDKIITYTLM